MTPYQRCLYVVSYPWLAMVFSSIKPGWALVGWLVWLGALTMVPKTAAMLGLVIPLVGLLLSMTASVLLMLDRVKQRYEAKERVSGAP